MPVKLNHSAVPPLLGVFTNKTRLLFETLFIAWLHGYANYIKKDVTLSPVEVRVPDSILGFGQFQI